MKKNTYLKKIIFLIMIFLSLYACQAPDPKITSIVAKPKTPTVKNITNFTPALRCMDTLFADYGITDYIITSAGLPDMTGKIQAGTKEMMISAISKLAVKSNSFRFVDYDQSQLGVQDLHDLIGVRQDMGFDIPRYYIRGAITQADTGVTSDSVGGGLSIPGFAVAANKDQATSIVSMDMNMADMVTRQILPGIQANNSITVVRSGKGGDVDGKIGKAGLFFQMSMDRSEGTHQSVRTLVELSLIEILGKLTKVPYWRCLEIPQTNPNMIAEIMDWFNAMDTNQKLEIVQQGLIEGGYLRQSSPSGYLDSETTSAISRYQAENDLIADGRLNFDLYYSMLEKNLAISGSEDEKNKEAISHINQEKLFIPVKFLVTTNKGATPTFEVGDKLNINIKMGEEGAYVYCYYQDDKENLSRVFPNRFNPDSYVFANKSISVPEEDSPFEIIFDSPNTLEKIACLASKREIGIGLPKSYMVSDLVFITNKTIEDVVSEFSKIDSKGLAYEIIELKIN